MHRLWIGIAFLAGATDIQACTCGPAPPPCQAFGHTEAVFLGTVTRIDETQKRVFLNVDRAYKGISTTTVELFDGGMCDGPVFRIGEKYLMYTWGGTQMPLPARGCTRSRHVSEAAEDLEYLNNLDKAEPLSSILGRVAFDDGSDDGLPLPGASVVISGEGREIRVKANEKGQYRADRLRPGTYTARVEHRGYYLRWESDEIEVHPGGCAEENFDMEKVWAGRVSGRLIAAEATVPEGVRISLLRVAKDKAGGLRESYHGSASTREGGRYLFENVEPGQYKIVVSELFLPTREHPFATTYYPNALNRAAAAVIEVPGASGAEYDIQLPPALPSRALTAQVLLENGKPAAWVQIQVRAVPGRRLEGSPKVAPDGRFSLDIFEGFEYTITALGPSRITSGPVKITYETAGEPLRMILRNP